MVQITDGSYHSSDHEEGAREEEKEDVRSSKVHVSDCRYVFVFAVLVCVDICIRCIYLHIYLYLYVINFK